MIMYTTARTIRIPSGKEIRIAYHIHNDTIKSLLTGGFRFIISTTGYRQSLL